MADISFKKIDERELPQFLELAIKEHAKSILDHDNNLSSKSALKISIAEILLPISFGLRNKKILINKIIFHDKKVGYIVFSICYSEMFLNWIYISPKNRSKGLGTKALKVFEKQTKDRDIKTITLDVFRHNAKAIKFYNKNGYQLDDKTFNADNAGNNRYNFRKTLR